eukprot:536378-Prymnesium_polylepis.1
MSELESQECRYPRQRSALATCQCSCDKSDRRRVAVPRPLWRPRHLQRAQLAPASLALLHCLSRCPRCSDAFGDKQDLLGRRKTSVRWPTMPEPRKFLGELATESLTSSDSANPRCSQEGQPLSLQAVPEEPSTPQPPSQEGASEPASPRGPPSVKKMVSGGSRCSAVN